jgi:hypothetical protein
MGNVSLCVPMPQGYGAGGIDPLAGQPHPIWDSRRLWSLWEMINFGLGSFLQGLSFLDYELGLSKAAAANSPDQPVDIAQHSRIKNNIEFVMRESAARLLLEETSHTCVLIEDLFRKYEYQKYTYKTLADILERLQKDIQRGASQQYFFHYPRNLAPLVRAGLSRVGGQWKTIVDAFPSAKREIETGVDCFAMEDYSGSVFHMMRIAELGLRAIAKERGVKSLAGKRGQPKPIEWGTWEEVFNAITGQLTVIRRANPGPKRDDALGFYDTAMSDLQTMRGLYRDPTMHFRETYDKGEAASAMFRVQSLMQTLSSKLREDRVRKIAWGL